MTQSMTTFASCSTQGTWGMATWEIRVVNHRYFDCALKIPEAFRSFEGGIRLQLQKQLHRGRIDCSLRFFPNSKGEPNISLNLPLVKKLLNAVQEVKGYLPMAAIDPMKVLSWPQVLVTTDEDLTIIQEDILKLFEKTLDELSTTRDREGSTLAKLITDRLIVMTEIVSKIKNKMPKVLTEQRHKIIKRLEDASVNLDQSRLEQEMVYFAQKIDITEEIDRLEAHIKEVKRVLKSDKGPIGKRLDFLIQELNREANTLASKSVDIEITQDAVELKVLIEEMREQVQNIV
jgi:uncharacterized protein (TIGR00255 family)